MKDQIGDKERFQFVDRQDLKTIKRCENYIPKYKQRQCNITVKPRDKTYLG